MQWIWRKLGSMIFVIHVGLREYKGSIYMRPQCCPPLFLPLSQQATCSVHNALMKYASAVSTPRVPVLPLPPVAEQKTSPQRAEVVSPDGQPCYVKAPGTFTLLRYVWPI